ncbi:hypothetical protein B0H14DRAFT_2837621 [Mycena olivaceomarginata]|nr:hypothetical protein B0H14DRAFT_2837621 [Mycena olivaceomarginata]
MYHAREKNLTKSWMRIKSTIPDFSEDMIALAGQHKLCKQICSEVQKGVCGARRDDSNSLKGLISDYIQPLVVLSDSGDPLPMPVVKFSTSGTKANCGLNTPVKFPATEETYATIRNGDIAVLGTDMPYLMYCDRYVFNPDNREDSLLEISTLFATMKHIYQGLSTALKPDGCIRGRAGNTSINSITALTDCNVGYVAIQGCARFGVSSQDHWNQIDVDSNYCNFYWSVVNMLQGEDGQEILNYFNMKVFGTKSSAKKATSATTTGPTDFDILAAQNVAKCARKIAATVESSASASN